jgi:hypothetical protein
VSDYEVSLGQIGRAGPVAAILGVQQSVEHERAIPRNHPCGSTTGDRYEPRKTVRENVFHGRPK